jgi:hypothetical protein
VPRSGDYLCARGTRPRAHSYEGNRRPVVSRGLQNSAGGGGGAGDYAGGGLDSPRMGKMRENAHNTSALNQGEEQREKRNAM